MLKAYKYRIYPNKQQEELIQKTFGCCRFVYNQTLAYRKEKYEKDKESLSRIDCNNWKNRSLKQEYQWLKEVDKFALDNAIINMDSAYQKFFKEHTGYPKFKSKHNHYKSYTTNFTNNNIEVSFENNTYFENVASVKPIITEVPTIEIVDNGNRVAKKD